MAGMPDRLLLITLSNIGDAVMTTPVFEALHRRHPEATIDIVADLRSSGIFEHCPYRGAIYHKHKREGWRGLLILLRALRRARYALVVDLRTDGLAYLLRAKRRQTRWGARRCGAHAVERHMAVIGHRNPDENDGIPPPRVWLDPASLAFADNHLAGLPGSAWLAIGPGANWDGKIWPIARYRELVHAVRHAFDAVLILGGGRDRRVADALATDLLLPYVDLAGATDLLQVSAVLRRARLFVGNDSGLGHLAAAVGTPTLTLFGPGEPERYHPWGPGADWIVAPAADLGRLTAGAVAGRLLAHLARTASITQTSTRCA